MSLLQKIFKSMQEPSGTEHFPEDSAQLLPCPEPQQYDYSVLVKLLFGNTMTHEEVAVIRGTDKEAARLAGYSRVYDQYGQQVIYGEADIIATRPVEPTNNKGEADGNN